MGIKDFLSPKPAQASGHGLRPRSEERAEEQASEHAGRAKRVEGKENLLGWREKLSPIPALIPILIHFSPLLFNSALLLIQGQHFEFDRIWQEPNLKPCI